MTPKSSQANWHLIHHHHITKLFHLLNQNTMFIIENKNTHFQIIHSFHHQKSIHTSFIIFSIPNNTITHKTNSSPLILNHEREQTPSTLLTRFFYVFSPQTPSLVVQSTVRSFPQVTPLFHKIILLDLPQSYKTEEYLTWSLNTTHNITPTVKKMSSAQAQTEN